MPPHLANAPNINHLWAALLVEELVRQGTTFFVVCPGSRSTPLAVAVAQNPRAEALVHWDERAAGFVALGWGRATGRPAAVVTTSGTAVANLLPAAVEADADNVPLLLLTADRPPELRETGANQAIRQMGIFSTVERWAFDLGVPSAEVDPSYVLTTVDRAVAEALSPPGPVHLNAPFREPLAPRPDDVDIVPLLNSVQGWATRTGHFERPSPMTYRRRKWTHRRIGREGRIWPRENDNLLDAICRVGDDDGGAHVLIVGGGANQALRWPAVSGMVNGGNSGYGQTHRIPYVDLVLASERFRELAQPQVVLQFGPRPLSKRLDALIEAARPEVYAVFDPSPRPDPHHAVTHHLSEAEQREELFRWLRTHETESPHRLRPIRGPQAWYDLWRRAGRVALRTVRPYLEGEELSEPAVAYTISRVVKKEEAVVAAASMPVRDLVTFSDPNGSSFHTVANRGASGIDGTVATAAGFARGREEGGLYWRYEIRRKRRPVVLHVGDLALLHDQTSLALLRGGPPVVVVAVNNDGGGIFHRLPIASGPGALADGTFEHFFGTPHGLTFEHAAAQVGLPYHLPTTMTEFEWVLMEALESGASALIEVRTDREEQAALRRRIEAAVAEAVDAALA